VVLFERASIFDDIFIVRHGSIHENTQWRIWPYFKGLGLEMLKHVKIHYSRAHFGIFTGKVTLDHETQNFYLVDVLYTHKYRQLLFIEIFPKVLSLEDIQIC